VRWTLAGSQPAAYAVRHIPGARFVDLDAELAAAPGEGGRHPLPDPAVLEAAMRRAGVSADSEVVAYDDVGGMAAGRAWWLLRWAGHERVRVLEGGLGAWEAAGLPVTSDVPPPGDGDFAARPGAMPVLDAEGAARVAREGLLLDVRAPERYRGEVEPMDPVAGHVPGAVSAPLGTDAQIPPDTEVGAYCGSGVAASLAVLRLEARGIPAALYAGSWSDWIRDPDRPVELGDGDSR
jgi:thiosulfate/3-mercaptopyruvate sulfurtransferase